jgi:NADH:ubiquinone oxidoreductase subunit 11 or 4L (chain K)
MITLPEVLSLGTLLFCISVAGIFSKQKNIIILLNVIELMLLSVNINFIAFSYFLGDIHGQFLFFYFYCTAADSGIGTCYLSCKVS